MAIPKGELFRRNLLFIISLFFSGLGIAFTRHGELGVTPIASLSNVFSLKYEFLSFGTWLILFNLTLVVMQLVLLRRNFPKIQLLQIPLSFLFGLFTDLGSIIANRFPIDSLYMRFMSVLIGTVILAFGISLAVIANTVLNSGEGAVKAIAELGGFVFGNVKIVFDISIVIISIALSLVFFDMEIRGIGAGTVFSAIFTGIFVKLFIANIREDIDKWINIKEV